MLIQPGCRITASMCLLVGLSGSSFASAAGANAQVHEIEDCGICPLEATVVAELGTEDGPGALSGAAHVVRRLNGDWVVADYRRLGMLKVFSPDGTYLRGLGRTGGGPGEYNIPERLRVLPGDSLEVVDFAGVRITTLSPSLRVARTRHLGSVGTAITFLPDGRHVVAADIRTARSIGLPLHLFSHDGQLERSFGAQPRIQDIENRSSVTREVASASDGTVWSAELLRYALERWDSVGNRLVRLERSVPWFPPQERYGARASRDQPPTPGLVALNVDSAGMLWVGVNVPDMEWQTAFEAGRDPYGRPGEVVYDLNAYYDGMIEVIDPRVRRVVGRARVDDRIVAFVGDGLVLTEQLRGSGYPVAVVWQVQDVPDPEPE